MNRRSFLTGALICAASNPLRAVTTRPAYRFPTDVRRRIAVATYPFRHSIIAPGNDDRDPSKPGFDLAGFARYIRSELKVYGIEPLHAHFPSTEPTEILKLRKAFDEAGVFIANIPVDEPVDLCSSDEKIRDEGNRRYRRWIDIAVTLRSPSIRVWIPKCANPADLAKAASALQPTVTYAATRNIVVNLENDDPVFDSAERIATVLRKVSSPYLRALPDFGNGLMGGDERFNANAVRQMFEQAYNISHVKDAELVQGVRKTASLEELFGIAKASGYRGYFSMESDSDAEPVADTKHLIAQSIKLM